MINPEDLQREKILYAYSTALEQGDFTRIETILASAANDPVLEQQIVELSLALAQPQGAVGPAGAGATAADSPPATDPAAAPAPPPGPSGWQRLQSRIARLFSTPAARHSLWRTSGTAWLALVGLFLVVVTVSALFGPPMRAVFQNIGNPLPTQSYAHESAAATQAPAALPYDSYNGNTRQTLQSTAQASASLSNGGYPAPQIPQQGAPATDRLIVRDANLTLVAKDTRQARQAVMALIAGYAGEGAFMVSSTESYPLGDQMPVISMVLRLPVARYDDSLTRLAALGARVLDRNESAQDVTQEYVDVTARIEALQTSRDRLLEIIKNATNTDDILKAENMLTQREAELEANQARQKYLSQTAALSSITLTLQPEVTSQPVADNSWKPGDTFHNAVRALLDSLRRLADGAIYFIIDTLPWLLVIGLIVYGALRLFRHLRTKNPPLPPLTKGG